MTELLRVAFGPLVYEVALGEGVAVAPWCARYVTDRAPVMRVVVERAEELPRAERARDFVDDGFVARHGDDEHRVAVARGRESRWGAALAALVSHDAPSVEAVVVHCAAVRVEGGAALLLAPGGTGKTTFARRAGARSFAHNAVIVEVNAEAAPRAWALPFAGDPHPDLDADGPVDVRVVALLERSDAPGFEWTPRGAATTMLIRCCMRAPAADPWARERFMLGLRLVARVAAGRMRTTLGPSGLEHLDAALSTENAQ